MQCTDEASAASTVFTWQVGAHTTTSPGLQLLIGLRLQYFGYIPREACRNTKQERHRPQMLMLRSRSAPAPMEAVAAQLLRQTVIEDTVGGDASKLSKAQRQRLRKKMREAGQE